MGTQNYMAPESFCDDGINEYDLDAGDQYKESMRTDIWMLGILLYYMVFIKTPFQDYKFKEKYIKNPNHQIQYNPKDPEYDEVIALIKRCLIRSPKERFFVVFMFLLCV